VSPNPSLPEFFVERSLGSRQVPAALRAAGWLLRTQFEVFGERDERVEDVEWLEYCGTNGLVVLTKDRRIRYRPQEIEALATYGVKAFALARGNLGAAEQSGRFIDQRETIERNCEDEGPFVDVVYASEIVRIFPP